MKIKGLTMNRHLENIAFASILSSLLPIFQTRLDIVAEWRLMLYGVTFLVTGIWVAESLIALSEQGKLRPVKYKETSGCAGWVNWTGCLNSCFRVGVSENVVCN